MRNDPKLFDFGLATEFRPEEVEQGTYKLTGNTGTVGYMAPEGKNVLLFRLLVIFILLTLHVVISWKVSLCMRYTEKVDVYSFGILLWQICQMEKPFEKLSDDAIERKVIQMGYRPTIDPQWPASIRRLLQDCFAAPPRRPSMEVVCDVLRHEIKLLSDKDLVCDDDLVLSGRSAGSA